MKKKAIKLSVMVMAGLTLYTSNAFSAPAIVRDYVCPIGGEKFKSNDFLPKCPENNFVMFKKEFTKEELKEYEKIVNSKEYKAIPKNSPKEYYLGRFYEMAGGFSEKEVGETYYKAYISQINEKTGNNNTLIESLTKGITYLEKSLLSKGKNDFPWSLAYLYVSNKEYDKANALIESQDEKIHLEKIANFYYSLSDVEKLKYDNYYDYENFDKESVDEKAKKDFREKALSHIQAVIRKNNGRYSEEELFRQADLYKALGNKKLIDELFSKTSSKYWSLIIKYYLDEPKYSIGEVFDTKKLATEDDLKKALNYAEKLIEITSKSSKNSGTNEKNKYNESIILKAETERRLGKFEEALKTLSKINLSDMKDTDYAYDFEKVKELVEKRDKNVSQYVPAQIMY